MHDLSHLIFPTNFLAQNPPFCHTCLPFGTTVLISRSTEKESHVCDFCAPVFHGNLPGHSSFLLISVESRAFL